MNTLNSLIVLATLVVATATISTPALAKKSGSPKYQAGYV
jgi:hypothetical protein